MEISKINTKIPMASLEPHILEQRLASLFAPYAFKYFQEPHQPSKAVTVGCKGHVV